MSDQYPRPGQPGELPPTQIAGGGVPPQPGQSPQQPGYPQQGGYPQQPGYPQQGGYPPQGGAPYGGGSGGGFPPPGPGGPGFPAPPTGGGGKRTGLVVGVVVAVLAIVVGAVVVTGLLTDWFGLADEDPKAKRTVTATVTASPSEPDAPEDPPEDTPDVTDAPTEDPTITAQAFFNSIISSDCLALEGLSTPEFFAREFGDQAGCEEAAGLPSMTEVTYDFEEPIVGDARADVAAVVTNTETGAGGTATWEMVASGDTWLVDGFTFLES